MGWGETDTAGPRGRPEGSQRPWLPQRVGVQTHGVWPAACGSWSRGLCTEGGWGVRREEGLVPGRVQELGTAQGDVPTAGSPRGNPPRTGRAGRPTHSARCSPGAEESVWRRPRPQGRPLALRQLQRTPCDSCRDPLVAPGRGVSPGAWEHDCVLKCRHSFVHEAEASAWAGRAGSNRGVLMRTAHRGEAR